MADHAPRLDSSFDRCGPPSRKTRGRQDDDHVPDRHRADRNSKTCDGWLVEVAFGRVGCEGDWTTCSIAVVKAIQDGVQGSSFAPWTTDAMPVLEGLPPCWQPVPPLLFSPSSAPPPRTHPHRNEHGPNQRLSHGPRLGDCRSQKCVAKLHLRTPTVLLLTSTGSEAAATGTNGFGFSWWSRVPARGMRARPTPPSLAAVAGSSRRTMKPNRQPAATVRFSHGRFHLVGRHARR